MTIIIIAFTNVTCNVAAIEVANNFFFNLLITPVCTVVVGWYKKGTYWSSLDLHIASFVQTTNVLRIIIKKIATRFMFKPGWSHFPFILLHACFFFHLTQCVHDAERSIGDCVWWSFVRAFNESSWEVGRNFIFLMHLKCSIFSLSRYWLLSIFELLERAFYI